MTACTETRPAEKLFAGHQIVVLDRYMGLTNERELPHICPAEFWIRTNPWHIYAAKLMRYGGETKDWKWKSDDFAVRENQRAHHRCIHSMMGDLSRNEAVAVCAWILSEILLEVPTHEIPKDYLPPCI